MLLDSTSREILFEIALLVLVVDTVFVGVIVGSLLRLLGVATWYRGLANDETVLYRFHGGATYRRWILWGIINAFVSDKRFIARVLWSRLALVDVPLPALRYVRPATWWWYHSIEVAWGTAPKVRSIALITSRRVQSDMLRAFEAGGVRVETS